MGFSEVYVMCEKRNVDGSCCLSLTHDCMFCRRLIAAMLKNRQKSKPKKASIIVLSSPLQVCSPLKHNAVRHQETQPLNHGQRNDGVGRNVSTGAATTAVQGAIQRPRGSNPSPQKADDSSQSQTTFGKQTHYFNTNAIIMTCIVKMALLWPDIPAAIN